MFSVEIKFRAGDWEVSLERFAALFLKEMLRTVQDGIRPLPTPAIPPAIVANPWATRTGNSCSLRRWASSKSTVAGR
jgi:hypothetical protein